MKSPILDGFLVIDKPAAMTSRDVVNRVQGCLPRGTRLGHTGTLDPLATGVLVLGVGAGTRLAEYVQDMTKVYRAGLLLGVNSDTDDADGNITAVASAAAPDIDAVTRALGSFVGTIDQVPPAFSAVKLGGLRAHDLARRGAEVALAARPVQIKDISLITYAYPRLDIEVTCGKGTYIRALARDLGHALGCGAIVESLQRTRVGHFDVKDALPLESDAATLRSSVRPLSEAVNELPHAVVTVEIARALIQGRAVLPAALRPIPAVEETLCAAFGEDGVLLAVLTWRQDRGKWVPHKVMAKEAGPHFGD
jgi:tRNA pseudouridine55 synthase